jgi:hypothetical protein
MRHDKEKSGLNCRRGERTRRRSKVVSLSDWQSQGRECTEESFANELPAMSVPQKKVALIQYILSDGITDQEIDKLLIAAARRR